MILGLTYILFNLILLGLFQALLQEAQISGCGRVLEAPGEAESGWFFFWFHGSLVQKVVGINVMNNGSVRKCHHHLYRKVVALQVQTGLFTQHGVLFISLQVFQFFDQRPATDEAQVEEGQNGRTFQDCLPESSP